MILEEYLTTVFLVAVPEGGWPLRFHIITAYNPWVIVTDEINAKADEKLRRELNLEGSRCFRVIGCSPDLKHREPGWGVAGLSEERICAIGRHYSQNAVFEVHDGRLSIIGCLTEKRVYIDSWENRFREETHESPDPDQSMFNVE